MTVLTESKHNIGTETVEHSEQVKWVYKYESTTNITTELKENSGFVDYKESEPVDKESELADKARKIYIDIDEPNGSYKIESAMIYTSPKGDRAIGESEPETINITGSMYDDFHSWGE